MTATMLDDLEVAVAALTRIGEHDAARKIRGRLAAARRINDGIDIRDLVVLP